MASASPSALSSAPTTASLGMHQSPDLQALFRQLTPEQRKELLALNTQQEQDQKMQQFQQILALGLSSQQIKAAAAEAQKQKKMKAHVESTHRELKEHPDPEVREAFKTIRSWAEKEFCAMETMVGEVKDMRKTVAEGVWGMRKAAQIPYADNDHLPIEKKALLDWLIERESKNEKLMVAIIDLATKLGIGGDTAEHLAKAHAVTKHKVDQNEPESKRKTPHGKRGCECAHHSCSDDSTPGRVCGCFAANLKCTVKCNPCRGDPTKCNNPHNQPATHSWPKLSDDVEMADAEKPSKPKAKRPNNVAPGPADLILDSWYLAGFLSIAQADEFMAAMLREVVFLDRSELEPFKAFGKTSLLPRDKAFLGDVEVDRAFYGDAEAQKYPVYRYGKGDHYPTVLPWPASMRALRDLIHTKTGQRCNHLVVNRYLSGADHIGYHKDKTRDFADGTHVFTVSFGAARKYRIQDQDGKVVAEVMLEHGSLNQLGWDTNVSHKHAIIKATENQISEVRYGLTFRTMKTWSNEVSRPADAMEDIVDLTAAASIRCSICKDDGRKTKCPCRVGPAVSSEVQAILAELNAMAGLEQVKQKVQTFIHRVEYDRLVLASGKVPMKVTNHMIFSGNPGSGKTTVARLMARLLKALKIVTKGQLIEGTRKEMVASYVGQSDKATAKVIKSAMGGVLFIDEIDSLCHGEDDSYGKEALKEIVTATENMRHDIVFIIAGYPQAVKKFLALDAGLPSRFPIMLEFPNFTQGQLFAVLKSLAPHLTPDAEEKVKGIIVAAMKKPGFANARSVRNIVEAAAEKRSVRVVKTKCADLETFVAADFC